MLLAERSRLALWLPVGLGIGIALYFALAREPAGGAILSLLVVAGGALAWIARAPHGLAARVLGGGTAALALGFVAAWAATHRQPPLPDLPRRATMVMGRVASVSVLPPRDGAAGDGALSVDLADARLEDPVDDGMPPLRRTLRLRLRPDDPAGLSPGMVVRVRAMLRPPMPPAWPGGPDRQRRAWFDGTAGGGYALARVQRVQAGPAPAHGTLETLREAILARILRVLPPDRAGVAAAVLTGSAAPMPQADRDAFADAGLAHLLAVAGLHLGIVMGVTMAVVRLLLACSEHASLFWPCRQVAALAGLAAGAAYVVLTGQHLPALRGLTMAALVVLALVTGRRALSMRGLAVGATLLLLTGPEDVMETPLQMSLAAVMALAAGFEAARPALRRLVLDGGWWRRGGAHVAHLALASLLAGGATVPVVMAHFGTLQPWFLLANLLAVPLMAMWILPAGLLAVLLMPLGLEAVALVPMGWGIGVVLDLARAVSGWPAARIMVPAMPGWALVAWLLGLCWACLWTRRWRWAGGPPMAVALLAPFLVTPPDLLVAADGRAVAVRDGGVLRVGPHPGADRVVEADWRQALALPIASLSSGDGRVACRDGLCRLAGGQVVLRLSGTAAPDCAGVALLVVPGGEGAGCPGVATIDGLSLWQSGAQAVYLRPDGPRVVTDRAARGARPWVMGPGQHGMPTLPLAKAE
ncbi:ComEC/Rec2 family competence protein [Gluconacetobacter azotocaptans]|uniref:ComEC/Rec2 family competence protein n=1 Tax=Gluconacetobacter azotocaptans TaxID=142834 RepID=UPI00195EDE0D|nr:ComEC/Rec2 family competence protein [Gluconacetobacter azotocaptans]MBM9403002.1 ComEC/Rec2 family competence protein [Gluconacetobacter azotocaptans]